MNPYKKAITEQMTRLSNDPHAVFIGYNTICGSRIYGTLQDVDPDKCIETPVAENLMMGLAIGMSLEGYKPVVCFERHDFMTVAMDAIVNHLDKLPELSGNKFCLPVVIRAIVGHDKPLDPGSQHKQDYTELIQRHTDIEVLKVGTPEDAVAAYDKACRVIKPIFITEYRELYT